MAPAAAAPGDRVGADAAVDLDVDVEAALVEHAADLGDLRLHGGDVGLAAEAGVHRHHEHHVDEVEDVVDGVGGRGRVEGDAGGGAELADRGRACGAGAVPTSAWTIRRCAAGLDVALGEQVGRLHHEVGLERQVGVADGRRR